MTRTEEIEDIGVDHLAVLESMIVKKDSVQNRAMRGCCGEIKRSRDEIVSLRSAIEVMIAAFCPGDDWVGVYVRDQADAALSHTHNPVIIMGDGAVAEVACGTLEANTTIVPIGLSH